jgi:phospholipid-binding lipoprotein MlaA
MTAICSPWRPVAALFMLAWLAGCTTLPTGTQADPRDPFERSNRAVFKFNETMDKAIAKPVARAYVKVVPRPVRSGLSNVLANAGYPTVIVSNLLQGKLKETAADTGRLLMNTVMGFGGLIDVASSAGLEAHNEDFGQVLGKWGIRSGPYLMLPVLGPSTLRDSFGEIPDQFANGTHYIRDDVTRYAVSGFRLLNDRANFLEADSALGRAADPYVLVRSVWLQRREYLVKDGANEPSIEEFADSEPPPE